MTSLLIEVLDERVEHRCLTCEREYLAIVVVSFCAEDEVVGRICPQCIPPGLRQRLNQAAEPVRLAL